jgi:ribosomal protein S27E
MRLCKDCWFFWSGKGICCHREAETDLTSGEKIRPALTMRRINDGCGEEGKFWRPKAYSPTKIYKFGVECPDCNYVMVFTLHLDDSGKKKCVECNKELWLPGYGENTISPKPIHRSEWFEFLEIMKNVKV